MSEIWQGVVVAICTNGLLLALVSFWLKRKLQRHEKYLDRINATSQTRFNKYHVDAVDAIANAYALFVELHNSVFRYCFTDWDADDTPSDERKKNASEHMVAFYEYFGKHQIFMEDTTIEHFETSFRFLQQVFLKKDSPALAPHKTVQVGQSVYADMTDTLPGMLQALRADIKAKIGP